MPLRATVLDLAPDGPAQVMVRLAVGESVLLARVSAKSAHLLQLPPGLAVCAPVQGVAILG